MMSGKLIDIAIVAVLLAGIVGFRWLRTARMGNLVAALALLGAVVVILIRQPVSPIALLVAFAIIGAMPGWWLARQISMVEIPAMVALQNGMGGMASFLVSFIEVGRQAGSTGTSSGQAAASLGIVVGAATFSGSLVAAGRLSRRLGQRPIVLTHHNPILLAVTVAALVLMTLAAQVSQAAIASMLALALIAVALSLGVIFSIRVGGADMPVLISFLNAGSGVAAALCGLSIGNWLLIAAGAMVGVSGLILTQIMCVAMNRSLGGVLVGSSNLTATASPNAAIDSAGAEPAVQPVECEMSPVVADPFAQAMGLCQSANRVIIVPGYGMALAEAQEEVSHLADKLVSQGKQVLFAIHPVAGRMPGHMHVLLAEAEVDYGMIRDLQAVNSEFAQTDLVLVVGACDVVNPAAVERPDTPISGMPILRADEARHVIVCNIDDRPGYSGVENPLYRNPKTTLLLGDAKDTVGRLLAALDGVADSAEALNGKSGTSRVPC